MVSVARLTIRRGHVRILNQLTWEIRPGENWVILGANGSGKTSLLSALTGYLTPTEGEICILSHRFGQSNWRDLRKRIGMVSSALRQMMAESETALETVASGRYAMIDYWGRPSKAERRAALEILRHVGCLHLADRPWAYLSQGERQRVLIGRALMARPKLLILDEPCAGLDPIAREHFVQFMQRLGSTPKSPSLILVTHHVEEIPATFGHGLLLKGGEVMGAGPLAQQLSSKSLTELFDCKVRLRGRRGRYRLEVLGITRDIM
jgi:iron complex transport system ATP-binding protein